MEEKCFLRERSGSNITPKFRQDSDGVRLLAQKEIEDDVTFERCCGVPISMYSVLEGLTVKRLFVSQVWTESSIDEITDRELMESEGRNEI